MIKFERRTHKDHMVDKKDGKIIERGTAINAELLNRYEEIIEQLVNEVNQLKTQK